MTIELSNLCPLLQVFDMPTAMKFYRDVLGFEIVRMSGEDDSSDWIWLRRGPAELMLNTQYERDVRPPAPDPERTSAHADTTLYFACEDLDAAYTHLRSSGVDAEPPIVRDYGMKQLYFRDPDGYALCLQWPAGG